MPPSPRRTAFGVAFALLLVPLAYAATGCNLVRLQQGRLESRMKDAGLVSKIEPVGEATVRYWEGGKGPALLFVHGFGAEAVWQWSDQVEAFAGGHRLIVPDLLWFGGSASARRDFSLEHQVATLVALLDKLGERQVDVVGISYGGLAALELAQQYPERVGRLVLVASPGCAYTLQDYEDLLARFGVARAADLFLPSDEAGVDKLMELAYADPPWMPGFARRQALSELYSTWREEKAALLESLAQSMARQEACAAANLQVPTLLVWGREDPVFPLALGERLAAGLGAKARLVVIDGARHAPNLEHPRTFNEALRSFLEPPQ